MAGRHPLIAVLLRPTVALPGDAPLDPTSDEARRWLEQELSSGRYRAQPSLFERLQELLDRLLSTTAGSGLPSIAVPIAIGLLVAVVALVLVRVLRRDVGGSRGDRSALLDVPDVPADELRRSALAALDRGDWDSAAVDGLRAIARRAVERVVLDDAPGRTAHEVAVALSARFPAEASSLLEAADSFDAVRYGRQHVTESRARAVVDLDERLRTARPAGSPAAADTPAPAAEPVP